MKTTDNLTIFTQVNSDWQATQVYGVQWQRQPVAALKSGMLDGDMVGIYIPLSNYSDMVKIGDVLVKGLVADHSIDDLLTNDDVAVVRAAEKIEYGSSRMHHWQITATRASLQMSAPETAIVYRSVDSADNAGWSSGATETPVLTTTCWIDDPGSHINLQTYAQRIGTRMAVVLIFPVSSDVRTGDRVLIGITSYEVIGPLPHSWEITRKVLAVVQA